MQRFLFPMVLALCAGFFPSLSAQSFLLTYQTPDGLLVCGSDTLRVTVFNNTGGPLSGAELTVTLPAGIEYIPGTVSGATESNIANPSQPTFAFAGALPPATPTAVRMQVRATCALVAAINNNQLFSAGIEARAGTLASNVTTTNFTVETPFLVITSVTASAPCGEQGDALTRTILVRNTRLGALSQLTFRDSHNAGIDCAVPGSASENETPSEFTAVLDGSYFTAFGDGDALFEYNEEIAIVQEITITGCGIPQYTVESELRTEWRCNAGDPACQFDATFAEVCIQGSTNAPDVQISSTYALPWSYCGDEAAEMRVRLVNTGTLPSGSITMILTSSEEEALGMDAMSFRLRNGNQVTPIVPTVLDYTALAACGTPRSKSVTLLLPPLADGDTVDILYDAYFCSQSRCGQPLPHIQIDWAYPRPCPSSLVTATHIMAGQGGVRLSGELQYGIGDCLADGELRDYDFHVRSERLLTDTGYVWLRIDIPYGVALEDCGPLLLDGKTPVYVGLDTIDTYDTVARLQVAFELPLSTDTATMAFCLRVTCGADASYVPMPVSGQPDENGSLVVYTPPCTPCGYRLEAEVMLTRSPVPDDFGCVVSACDSSLLFTECEECIGDPPVCEEGTVFFTRRHVRAYRTNFGLADADNDRKADGTGTADPLAVRRDRFMPGDTMEAVSAIQILTGANISALFNQFFVETAESNIGYAGVNDTFFVPTGRNLLTKATRFRVLDADVLIWDASSGAQYTCPLNDVTVQDDTLVGAILPVNVEPSNTIDRFITMNHVANVFVQNLYDAGCVPSGFLFAGGDSLEVRVRYKTDFNWTPFSPQNNPPLINFEVGVGWRNDQFNYRYNYRRFDTVMLQYSGFIDTMTTPFYGIRPCDVSNELRRFRYSMRLARPNLFPNEVRPLSRILDYSLTLPTPDSLPNSVLLSYLELQDNVPVFQDDSIDVVSADTVMQLDFSPFFEELLDEGYRLEVKMVFPENCDVKEPKETEQTVVLDYFNCLQMPDPDTVRRINALGYLSNRARVAMTTIDPSLQIATSDVSIDVQLANSAPVAAPNFFIRFVSDSLTDFSVLQMPGGGAYPAVNGIFQLGTFPAAAIRDLRIRAMNTACEPTNLRIIYGWHCDPYTDTIQIPCSVDTLTVTITTLPPQIELAVLNFPADIPLCDTSDYIVVELSNADEGYAYTPYLTVQMPAGVELVPGSFALSYPGGSPYTALPAPTLQGNTFRWSLDTLAPAIAADGLPGVTLDPLNRVRLRFRVVSACGAVSNTQLIFGAGATQICGAPTNLLRKASPPLLIDGFAPEYTVQLGVLGDPAAAGCATERELMFSAAVSGTPSTGDSLYVLLPPGFSYVANSYVPGLNAPAGPPTVSGQQVQLPLPAGPGGDFLVNFSLRVRTPATPLCAGATITVQTRQDTTAFCALTGTDCVIYVATGETFFNFNPATPALTVGAAGIAVLPDGSWSVNAELTNAGTTPLVISELHWYHDVDGDDQLSAADTLVLTLPASLDLPPGIPTSYSGTIPAGSGPICNLLLVLPPDPNCLCAPAVYPLPNTVQTDALLEACTGAAVTVGVPAQPGYTYAWSAPAPCTDCPEFSFVPPAAGDYVFTLTEQGAGCTAVRQFTVTGLSVPALLNADTAICRGQTVTLQTEGGAAWVWTPAPTGTPGPTLTVQPAANTTYTVAITAATGCTANGSVTVSVLDSSLVSLGVIRTCAGTPVDVFGNQVSTPGTYCQTLPKSNGCDSTVCLTLEVVPGTSEAVERCLGQTITIFGQPVTAAGTYCQSFPSSLGCDSTHCVIVSDLSPVNLPFADTVLVVPPGEPFTLEGPAGFAAYNWSPATDLSCSTCPNPVLTPADTAFYTVLVTDTRGCSDSIVYRLFTLPPCDPARVEMPNAFTPNGDGENDVFRPVVREGAQVNYRLTVWNRWGEKVAEVSGLNAAWDGNFGGKPAAPDVYLWMLTVDCYGELTQQRGEVSLLK